MSHNKPSRFLIRGVVEGFFGPPWPHEERLEMINFLPKCEFNLYIYAPKDDPFHRERWRKPYPKDQLAKLRALIEAAEQNLVNFCFAISPGLSIRYSSHRDFEALTEKVETIRKMDTKWFGLFFDDIPMKLQHEEDKKTFKSLAEAQAYLANKLLKFLRSNDPETVLILCPTQYTGISSTPYLKTLGSNTDQNVFIMWTGSKVCSPKISSRHADGFGAAIRRKPFIWDNYPVNDYNRFRLFLGPLRGRSKDLYKHVSGFVANPMNEAESSKIPLLTIADYLRDPENYEPERSWKQALRKVGGERAYKYLRTFGEQSQSSFLWKTESPKLFKLIDSFWKNWKTEGWEETAEALMHKFKELIDLQANLLSKLENRQLSEELLPYVEKLSLLGKIGIKCVDLLRIRRKTESATQPKEIRKIRLEIQHMKKKAKENKYQICGALLKEFTSKTLQTFG
jgi:hyaluronoglucosaminidase